MTKSKNLLNNQFDEISKIIEKYPVICEEFINLYSSFCPRLNYQLPFLKTYLLPLIERGFFDQQPRQKLFIMSCYWYKNIPPVYENLLPAEYDQLKLPTYHSYDQLQKILLSILCLLKNNCFDPNVIYDHLGYLTMCNKEDRRVFLKKN